MKRIVMFLMLLALWILLDWPFRAEDGRIALEVSAVLPGAFVALLAALIMGDKLPEGFMGLINPVRIFWVVVYAFVFVFYVVRANFDVAYRILHPAMPIRPGIVKVKTTLKRRSAIAMLSNAIALTPGTLTVDARENGDLFVHWINVRATDVEGATAYIVKRFEWFIRKILE